MRQLAAAAIAGVVLAAALFAALLFVRSYAHAATPTPVPATPAGLPATIEPLAPYVEQTACDPVGRTGTVELARLLAGTYRAYGGTSWSSTYACGTDGTRSEHYDGRAIDWMVGIRDTKQHAAATAVITWLLATDRAGHKFAMARRLGVMYLIYDNRMWGAWSGRWEEYDNCAHRPTRADDNACHRTHLHISLSWNGATGHTSYWTKRVYPTDFGPCRPRDLNWAYRRTVARSAPCLDFPRVVAASSASATKKALVTYSGAAVRSGWKGPAVAAVQRALHVSQTGTFDSRTASAVRSFQTRHGLVATGAMNSPTWRKLLAAVR
jgi:peptidoglycan hydrolase-like protein with peptidoglycan-binding domain